MGLQQVNPASGDVVTVAEAKGHCSIDIDAWDSLLQTYIDAAVLLVEQFTGKALGAQTWLLARDAFPTGAIELGRGPVTAINWVKYYDSDGVEQTLDAGVYILDGISDPQRLVPDPDEQWPATQTGRVNAVTVQFVTGFTTTPPTVKLAILMAVAAWFETRAPGALPEGCMQLLRPFRRVVI